eukprot:CAMPEP_0174923312 /NCGR_PEP_ID=MMETSP1355-20121228/6502_1 /TAXON_ID=464990 /ORGANISM="Hemiselmis tepida, Strain CCMP443" /LENGTH=130 /DNA_ID=CAMNT_0016168987 /DNA_START=85 /DNA_END=474 /DNA_ORIENTATION=+
MPPSGGHKPPPAAAALHAGKGTNNLAALSRASACLRRCRVTKQSSIHMPLVEGVRVEPLVTLIGVAARALVLVRRGCRSATKHARDGAGGPDSEAPGRRVSSVVPRKVRVHGRELGPGCNAKQHFLPVHA